MVVSEPDLSTRGRRLLDQSSHQVAHALGFCMATLLRFFTSPMAKLRDVSATKHDRKTCGAARRSEYLVKAGGRLRRAAIAASVVKVPNVM